MDSVQYELVGEAGQEVQACPWLLCRGVQQQGSGCQVTVIDSVHQKKKSLSRIRLLNFLLMLKLVSLDEDTSEFTAKSTFDHPYPTTKIMWIPDSKVLH